jgi:hypothetical protein
MGLDLHSRGKAHYGLLPDQRLTLCIGSRYHVRWRLLLVDGL